MTIGEKCWDNCMIDTGDFRLKGYLVRGVSWQPGNNGATPLQCFNVWGLALLSVAGILLELSSRSVFHLPIG